MHGWPLLFPKTFCWWMITQFCAINMMAVLGSFSAEGSPRSIRFEAAGKVQPPVDCGFWSGAFRDCLPGAKLFTRAGTGGSASSSRLDGGQRISYPELHRTLHHAHHREDDRAHNHLPAAGN